MEIYLPRRRVIAIDQDVVLAKLHEKWLKLYNEDFGDNLTPNDLKSWNIVDFVKPECGEKIFGYLQQHKFYRDLEVVEDAVEVTKMLSERCDLFIATDAMFTRMSFKSKFDWLQEHFPHISSRNYVFCGNKSIIKADYLIDDGIHNLEVFDGHKILFDAPHNQGENRFDRVKGWKSSVNNPNGVDSFFIQSLWK